MGGMLIHGVAATDDRFHAQPWCIGHLPMCCPFQVSSSLAVTFHFPGRHGSRRPLFLAPLYDATMSVSLISVIYMR